MKRSRVDCSGSKLASNGVRYAGSRLASCCAGPASVPRGSLSPVGSPSDSSGSTVSRATAFRVRVWTPKPSPGPGRSQDPTPPKALTNPGLDHDQYACLTNTRERVLDRFGPLPSYAHGEEPSRTRNASSECLFGMPLLSARLSHPRVMICSGMYRGHDCRCGSIMLVKHDAA